MVQTATATKRIEATEKYDVHDPMSEHLLGQEAYRRIYGALVGHVKSITNVLARNNTEVPTSDHSVSNIYHEIFTLQFKNGIEIELDLTQRRQNWAVPVGYDKSNPINFHFERIDSDAKTIRGKKFEKLAPEIEVSDLAGAEAALIQVARNVDKVLRAKR